MLHIRQSNGGYDRVQIDACVPNVTRNSDPFADIILSELVTLNRRSAVVKCHEIFWSCSNKNPWLGLYNFFGGLFSFWPWLTDLSLALWVNTAFGVSQPSRSREKVQNENDSHANQQ